MKLLVLVTLVLLALAVCWLSIRGPESGFSPHAREGDARTEAESVAPVSERMVERAAVRLDVELVVTVSARASAGEAPRFRVSVEGPLGERRVLAEHELVPGAELRHRVGESGRYVVRAAAEGWTCVPQSVDVDGSEARVEVPLEAEAAHALDGRVVDEDGAPVAGAEVRFLEEGGASPLGAVSGEDGGFRLAVPRDGGALRLLVLAAGFAPARPELSDGAREALVTLTRGWRVTGRVVDERDLPVVDAALRWRPRERRSAHEERWLRERGVRSDAAGAFALVGVTPGVGDVVAEHPEHADGRARIGPGDAREVVVRLMRGFALAGTVRSVEGGAIGDAEVELTPAAGGAGTRRVWTGAEGEFRFERVASGSYVVAAHAPGRAPAAATVEVPSAEPVELVLVRPARLVGELRTSASPRYAIELVGPGGRIAVHEVFAEPRFAIDGLPAGDFTVRVAEEGAPRREVATVTLASGEETDLGILGTSSGARLTGRVVHVDGRPAEARCSLSCREPTGRYRQVAQVASGSDGGFVFSDLAAGRYRLTLSPKGAAYRTVEDVRVQGWEVVDLGPLEVPAGAALEVLLLGFDGEPLAGKSLTVGDGEVAYNGRTDESGRHRREGLRPGSCNVAISVDRIPYFARATTRAGETTQLVFSLRDEPRGSWSARLVGAEGPPPEGCGVLATAEDGSWRSRDATTDADGRFTLEGRLEGAAVLDVWGLREGFPPVRLPVLFGAPGEGPAEIRLPSAAVRGTFPEGCDTLRLVYVDWAEGRAGLRRRGERFAEVRGGAGEPFEMAYLLPGRYRLERLDELGDVVGSTELALEEGEELRWSATPSSD